jgi:hypothetical protein
MDGSEEEEEQVERLTNEAERETRSLKEQGDELADQIDDRRGEWKRRHGDETDGEDSG